MTTNKKFNLVPKLYYMKNITCNIIEEAFLRAIERRRATLCSRILAGDRPPLGGSRTTQYFTRKRIIKRGRKNENA